MFGRFLVATKKKLGPQPAVFIHWENSRLDRPEAHPPCAVFLLYILSDGTCFIFMDGMRKDLARSSCTVTAIDDGRKKEPRSAIVHHGPQAQDKSCSRGLVMTWFLPRPWPAFHGQLGPGVGLFIRLGVGCAGVVWDVRGWCGMYSRLEFSGYVRKYALCRRGMVAGRSPP